jgi:N6-L-threonylcarbamoyladenine synthase
MRTGAPTVRSDVVLSQLEEHSAYGGVVPEIAARAHVEALDTLIEEALKRANVSLSDIDAIAATSGPGLIGGLLVGLMTGKAIAKASGKPLYAINHLEGHALTARLTDGLSFPYLMLLVSGGHTQLILVRGVGEYERWGTTIDDALGEAFDKTAKLLSLPYPGGPAVERRRSRQPGAFPVSAAAGRRGEAEFFLLRAEDGGAAGGDRDRAAHRPGYCRYLRLVPEGGFAYAEGPHRPRARALQGAFPDVEQPALVVAGGVAANLEVRGTLQALCDKNGFRFVAPPLQAVHRQCGDDRLGRAGADGDGRRPTISTCSRARAGRSIRARRHCWASASEERRHEWRRP